MIVDFHPCDIDLIKVQKKQEGSAAFIPTVNYFNLNGDAFTYIEDKPCACIGIEKMWGNRWQAWAHIGSVKNWVAFTRAVKSLISEYIDKHGIIRLELTTDVGFDESERWAKMLGFEFESYMPKYGIDGGDMKMWVII